MARTIGLARRTSTFTSSVAPRIASQNTVTRVKKRGWPKGKPRKGYIAKQKGEPASGEQQQTFPFMNLPLELRRQVYGLALPQQDIAKPSSHWANIVGTPNEFMNLLLVNKQISDEARNVLYGLNRFTMLITSSNTLFLGSFSKVNFVPFPTTPSLPFIKHWQMSLWPEFEDHDSRFRDGLLSACCEMARIPDLQTLTLVIPCLCHDYEYVRFCGCFQKYGLCHCLDIDDVHDNYVCTLAPLNQLRFKRNVQIVATAEVLQHHDDTSDAVLWPGWDDKDDHITLSRCSHLQCQKPVCVSFAASFSSIRANLMGNTTPLRSTEDQNEWLELKQRVAELKKSAPELKGNSKSAQELHRALQDTWDALDSGSNEYFRKMSREVSQKLRSIIGLGRFAGKMAGSN
ncbi:MAG: hypothetical protein Q9213_001227 [Squamulea squamosa]